MKITWIRALLAVSGVYDAVIGAAFLFAAPAVFRMAGIAAPGHFGYVRFPAMLLIIFGIMFFRAAADPVGRSEFILYGMALKLSYFSLVFWYRFRGGIPSLWIPFAYADVVFFLLFFLAWRAVTRRATA